MPIATLYAARNIDFAPTINLDYEGVELPLTGAAISLQIRLYPGASGSPLASDPSVEFADAVHPIKAGWRRLTVSPEIPKGTLLSFPGSNQPTPGDAQTFVHEIKISYADGVQEILLSGEFVLSSGVNFA